MKSRNGVIGANFLSFAKPYVIWLENDDLCEDPMKDHCFKVVGS